MPPLTRASSTVPADRLANFRDLGGLPVSGGGCTRSGILLRSDAPIPGDRAPDGVISWPPAVVIDLRSAAERAVHAYQWPARTVVHERSLHAAAAPTAEDQPRLRNLYDLIIESALQRVARLVPLVAAAPGTVLVHCAVGKDRTGIAVAVLLAADVVPQAVIDDYLVTAANLDVLWLRWVAKNYRTGRSRVLPATWSQVSAGAIQTVVHHLLSWPGGPRGWMVHHGASAEDLDAWESRLSCSVSRGTRREGSLT